MFFGGKELILFEGVVEDRNDPLFLGRVRVRVIGFHDEDKQKMPTDTLPWALPLLPPDSGRNVVGYKEGDYVAGYFRDGEARQLLVILGMIPGIPEKPADPEVGYNDPTPDSMLTPGMVPRPPEMIPPEVDCGGSVAGQSLSNITFADLSQEQKEALVDAQARAEGADKPGSLPNRLNNPGAMVYAPWQQKYGAVPGDKVGNRTFAKFPTREQGRQAQIGLWESKAYRDKPISAGLKKWVDPDNEQAFQNYTSQVHKAISSKGPTPAASVTACDLTGQEAPLGKYDDPNKLPIQATSTGQLEKEFGTIPYPYDMNGDGKYSAEDAFILIEQLISSFTGEGEFFSNVSAEIPQVPISRYPLENQLKESIASRLARNEKTELTIVARKKGSVVSAPTGSHESTGVGTDKPSDGETLSEPQTPYDAKYPYNHVYESESGHVVEYDDTPLIERIHTYHRSGTFKEVHPSGIQVDKSVGDRYDLSLKSANYQAEENVNITSKKILRVHGTDEITIESGDVLNQDSKGDRNVLVGGNANTRVKENVYTVIEGDVRILIKGTLNVAVEGDIKVKCKKDVLIDGENTRIEAQEQNVLKAGSEVLTETPLNYFTGFTDGDAIHAFFADTAGLAIPGEPIPLPKIEEPDPFENENDADNKDNLASKASLKEGYILNEDSPMKGSTTPEDLYKPVSDSDGNLVVLSKQLGAQPKLYEALPTGELQDALIQYKHKDGSITEWNVMRPVHKKGKFIEAGRYSGNGNGGRDHWRFTKPGGEYPTPLMLQIGPTEYIIVESGVRHEAIAGG